MGYGFRGGHRNNKIDQFFKGEIDSFRSGNLYSYGDVIYTYGVRLAVKIGNKLYVNQTKYSITSTIHYNDITSAARGLEIVPVETENELYELVDQPDPKHG